MDPKDIYKESKSALMNLRTGGQIKSEDPRVIAITSEIENMVVNLEEQLGKAISVLENSAEWDNLTCAFYGETNAGKSTLIEFLRLSLKDELKHKEQFIFNELVNQYGISEENIGVMEEELRNAILEKELQEKINKTKIGEVSNEISGLEQELDKLNKQLEQIKENMNFFRRILLFAWNVHEQEEIKKINKEVKEKNANINEIKKVGEAAIMEVDGKIDSLSSEKKKIEGSIEKLQRYKDGRIIGDGRSDFTKNHHTYYLRSKNGMPINIIDIPGIEGNEKSVSEQIEEAVRKAHVVFYVTSKASPPQKGEGKTHGTLEKIKQHVSDQAEVWAIYNKRITNPIAMASQELISEDEQKTLEEMDKTLNKELDEIYKGHLNISALPAFLASSQCLIPFSAEKKSRDKFIAKLGKTETLDKSGASEFLRFLTVDFAKDYKNRIEFANRKKVDSVFKSAVNDIYEIVKNKLMPLQSQVKLQYDGATNNLTSIKKEFILSLKMSFKRDLSKMENDVRDYLYGKIDLNISNDDLKRFLTHSFEKKSEEFKERLQNSVSHASKEFERKVAETVNRFKEYTTSIFSQFNASIQEFQNIEHVIIIDTDSGISYMGLAASIAGGIMLIWNPLGWFTLVTGLVSVAAGAYKAVRSFFSKEYKRAQQRKAVDDSIDRTSDKISEMFDTELEKAAVSIDAQYNELFKLMGLSVYQVREQILHLDRARKHFESIRKLVNQDTTRSNSVYSSGNYSYSLGNN